MSTPRMRLRPTPTLILALLLALGTGYFYFGLLVPESRRQDAANAIQTHNGYGGDFYPIWLTGRALVLHRTDPYTRDMTRNIQTGLYGRTMDPNRPSDQPADYRAFAYPLYTDLLALPLLPFSFDGVRGLLSFVLAPLTAVSVVLWLRVLGLNVPRALLATLIILTVINYPVLEGLYLQQVGLLVAGGIAMSVAALVRGRLWLAGILLACASVKPQMVWLVALFLVVWALSDWKNRKQFVFSFAFTMASLFLICQVLLPGWFFGWCRVLAGYSAYTLPPLPQLVLGRFLGPALALALFLLAGAVGWKSRRRPADSPEFILALSFILAATPLLLSSGGAVYDQMVMLPGMFWLISRRQQILDASRPIRVLALAAIVAVSWQWITASAIALLSLAFPVWAHTSAVLVFPTRMAASLPFAVIALLSFFAAKLLRRDSTGAQAASEIATA